jgi:ubiquinone/menaquinone biosynthesis C-methylase UbiE
MNLVERILEPELMEDAEQARAYSEADFGAAHDAVVTTFARCFPNFSRGAVLDIGCGPADVTVRFARAYPSATIVGVDGSAAMLALAGERLAREVLNDRVALRPLLIPDPLLTQTFDAVLSTSLLHHLHRPETLWETVQGVARPGTAVFVMDLLRPATTDAAQAHVDRGAHDAPDVLRRDYYNSLCAAFTVNEVRAQVAEAGLPLTVETIDDTHLAAWGVL